MMLNIFLKIIFIATVLASTSVNAESTPSWVYSIRSGNNQAKINIGDKVMFRTNIKENKVIQGPAICEYALDKNKELIKHSIPFAQNIPMTVEVVFYDEQEKDCSVSISVKKEFVDKSNELAELNSNYNTEMITLMNKEEKLKNEFDKISNELFISESNIYSLNQNENNVLVELKTTNLKDSELKEVENSLQNNNEQIKLEIKKLNQEIENIYSAINISSDEINSLRDKEASLKLENENIQKEIDSLKNKPQKKNKIVKKIEKSKSILQNNTKIIAQRIKENFFNDLVLGEKSDKFRRVFKKARLECSTEYAGVCGNVYSSGFGSVTYIYATTFVTIENGIIKSVKCGNESLTRKTIDYINDDDIVF